MSNWKDNWTKDKRLNSSLGMLGGASSIFSSAYGMATPNTDIMMSNVDNQIDSMKNNQVTMQPSSLDSLLGQWAGHQYLDTDYNAEDYYTGPSGKDILTNTLNSTISGATTGATTGPWGALIGGAVGLGSGLIGGFIGKNKAEEAAEEAANKLREESTSINNFQQASFMNAAKNIQKQNARMLASKVAAFGGALGGYGADWTNGLTMINNGGTHGENPLGGVPMGIAQDGQPNLVEEGEVIWNDYVFSNRLKVPNKIKEKYKLKGNTFAEVVNKAQEASAERPNDSIEKRGLDSLLNVLMQEQEMIRQKKAEREQRKQGIALRNLHALGGRLFAAGGDKDIPPALLEKLKIATEGTRMSPESFYRFLVNRVEMTPEQIDLYLSSKSTGNVSEELIKGVFQASKKNELIDAMYGEGTVDQLNNIKWLYDNLKNAEQYKTNIQEAKSLYYEALNALPDYISDIIDNSRFTANDSRFESGWVKDYQDRYSFDDEGNPYFTFTEQPNKTKSAIKEEYIPINNAKDNIDEISTLLINEIPRVDISDIGNHNISNDFYRAALKNIPSIPPRTLKEFNPILAEESLLSNKYNNEDNIDGDSKDEKYRRVIRQLSNPNNLNLGRDYINSTSVGVLPMNNEETINDVNTDTPNNTATKDTLKSLFLSQMNPFPGISRQNIGTYSKLTEDEKKTIENNKPLIKLKDKGDKKPFNWETALRYAPILGNTIGLGYTLLNPVSHKYADELDKAALEYTNALPKVSPTMLGDYLAYNPFDRMFYANELGAQQAASRRAIINNSANKGAALAGLLASDYANNVGLGKLYREGEEYNLAQRQKVADFNRGTNMANMEADLKAQMANAEMDRAKTNLLLDAKIKSLGMKQAGDAQWDANLATNLSGLFNNLGDIGWEAMNRNMVNSNLGQDYIINNDGTITYKGKVYAPKKNGGYLTIRRKRNA